MQCVDVNVLLHACFRSSSSHGLAHDTLGNLRVAPEGLGLFSTVISGFLRIATDRRVFSEPITPGEALGFVTAILASPTVAVINPGPRHWTIFSELVTEFEPRSSDVTDVWLAAAVMELNATWVSFDRGFSRFRAVRWVNPAAAG